MITRFKILSLLLITLCFLSVSDRLYASKGILAAGTAKINITPVRDEPIHDSLYARVLILEINEEKLAFVAVDQGIYTSEKVEKICKERYGISQLFLSSSHNHSSGKLDADYVANQIIKAIG
jgi:neutral ceramidase